MTQNGVWLARATVMVALVGLLSACGPRAYCKGEHAYTRADSVSSLSDVEGLRVPRSSSALVIPPEELEGPAYAETYEDERGRTRYRCLDMPPALPPLAGSEAAAD